MPMKNFARFAIPVIALIAADLASAVLLYKFANVSGQDALAYSGLLAGLCIFWFLGRKNDVEAIAPAITAGLVTSTPLIVFGALTLVPTDDHVTYLAQISPLCGALLGCNLGILASRGASNNSFKPTPLRGAA